ncbi:MAG TPA: FkbM family methyltransferase [Panacibacter sp.]|nr:FkbM family methyltransferase [Panacibacter sp.]
MVTNLFRNLYYAAIAKYSASKKIGIFFTLTTLSVKQRMFKKASEPVHEVFFRYKISGSDYASLSYLYKEVFCSGDYFLKLASKEPVIIDCGANIGMATLYFKQLFPAARIMAFEANPNIYELLKKNIENNNITNTELYNVALYNEEKELSFFTGDDSGNLRGSVMQGRGRNNEVIVKAQKLSGYLRKIEKADIIKMDVEGAELQIIQDLFDEGLLQKADQYIIEYHHNIGGERPALSEFLRKFESNGFGYSIRAKFYHLKNFQDILLYFYKL